MRVRVEEHSKVAKGWEVLGHTSTIPPFNFLITNNIDEAYEEIIRLRSHNEILGMDTETNSLEWEMPTTEMHGFSVAGADNSIYVYGMASSSRRIIDTISTIINESRTAWYNISYDLHILEKYGIIYNWSGLAEDVYIMSRLNNRGDNFSDGGLKGTAFTYLDHANLPKISALLSKYGTINDIPIEILGRYSAFDARITYDLYYPIYNIISREKILGKGDKTLYDYYKEEHLKATEGTYKMEQNGMYINIPFLKQVDNEALQVITDAGNFWERATGCNMNSSSQKSYFFFDVLGHKSKKKTDAGTPSTEAGVLRDLAIDGDRWANLYVNTIAPASKIRSTYTQPIIDKTARLGSPWIHGSFSIPKARTGRAASSDPNLQNIPVKGVWGGYMRQSFSAPLYYKFVRADFSQLELRVLAHFTSDPAWLEMFRAGGDPHELTATTVGVTRDQAKVVNFGIIYGMSPKALAMNMKEWGVGNMSEQQAEEIIGTYFTKFAKTREWMDRVHEYTRKLGYVQTILGRKRWLPDINSRNTYDRGKAERQAVNTIIQGSAADIMNRGIINTVAVVNNYNAFMKDDKPMMLATVVHDEICCYVAENQYLEALASRVGKALQNAGEYVGLRVPLVAEPQIGLNWSEVK